MWEIDICESFGRNAEDGFLLSQERQHLVDAVEPSVAYNSVIDSLGKYVRR